jgi:hypothetical protein
LKFVEKSYYKFILKKFVSSSNRMSSDNESCDLNYGIEDEVGNSFVKNPDNPLGKEKFV